MDKTLPFQGKNVDSNSISNSDNKFDSYNYVIKGKRMPRV